MWWMCAAALADDDDFDWDWDEDEDEDEDEEHGELELSGFVESFARFTRTGARQPFVGDATLRRVEVELEKEFAGVPLEAEIELEWENAIACDGCRGSVEAEEAYLAWTPGRGVSVDAGLMLVPFGRVNLQHDPTDRWSADRPMVDQTVIPTTWRELGVGVRTSGRLRLRGALLTPPDPTRLGPGGIGPANAFGGHVRANALAAVARVEGDVTDGVTVAGSAYGTDLGRNGDFYDEGGQRLRLFLPLVGAEADLGVALGRLGARGEIASFWFPDADVLLLARRDDGSPWFVDDPFTVVPTRWWGGWFEVGCNVLPSAVDQRLTPFARVEVYDMTADAPEGRRRDPARDVVDTMVGAAWQPMDALIVSLDADWRDRRLGLDDRIVELGLGWTF